MEYYDILDKEGKKIGVSKPKKEVHETGLWHRTVHVWCINSKKEILLQLRSTKKDKYPGMWDISAAGHISAGEDSITSCLRETEEELGINVSPDEFEFIGEIVDSSVVNNGTYIDNEFDDIYILKIDLDINQFHMQETEVDDLRWVSFTEFKEWVFEKKSDLVPHDKEYKLLINYLENKWN
jgi:isopentenyldiphosphate isomerase